MGTDLHCTNLITLFQNRCARVDYAKRNAPKLVYQYPGEAPETIQSTGGTLSYTFEETYADNTLVHVFGTFTSKNRSFTTTFGGCNVTRYWRTASPARTPIGQPFVNSRYNTWGLSVEGGQLEAAIRAFQG